MRKIKIKFTGDVEPVIEGTKLLNKKLGIVLEENGTEISVKKDDCLSVSEKNGVYSIGYSVPVEFFRGLAICVNRIRTGSGNDITQKRLFDTCGVMFDVSRNMVMTVETAKDFIEYMALMGLNMAMLYTEDTYEMEKYPYFGYMRGAYTKDEIKEIDAHCIKFGIELIPCIQTLSHLGTTLRWSYSQPFANTSNTLCVGAKETHTFIEDMFRTISECFTSKRIHIGLDEAHDINGGRILKKRGYIPKENLMAQHVRDVCEIAEKYGFRPMMWSDMFYKFGKIGGDYDYTSKLPPNYTDKIPKNIEMVYWDYCMEKKDVTDMFINRHKKDLNRPVIFAGGIWTWDRVTANYDKSLKSAKSQLAACKENNIKDVFVTVWNNTCAMYNLYSILPGLQMWAEQTYSNDVSDKQLKEMFEICTGYNYDDFMLLGLDGFTDEEKEKYADESIFCINSSAQFFFNDILTGLYDKTLSGFDFKSHYEKYAKGLKKVKISSGRIEKLFEQSEILTDILVIKSDINAKIIKAYKDKNMDELSHCLDTLHTLLDLYDSYHKISMDIWYKNNKPFGWDGCDIFLGGCEARIKSAIIRICDYVDGKVKNLPELEVERLYYNGIEKPLTESNEFKDIISASHI